MVKEVRVVVVYQSLLQILMRRKIILGMIIGLFLIVLISSIVGYFKTTPEDISFNGEYHYVEDVEFLYDLTYQKDNERVHEQQIVSRALQMIEEAEELIILDLFLFNDDYERKEENQFPDVSNQITNALIEKKKQNPAIEVVVITDEINIFYYSYKSPFLERLREEDIDVVITDMGKLRDSNPVYSGLWRAGLQWFGPYDNGWLGNPFSPDSPDVTLTSYMRLANFKANHRKVLLTEQEALVTSANIGHDGSSLHSNVAFVVKGNILQDIYNSERAVALLSGSELEEKSFSKQPDQGDVKLKLITEKAIQDEIIASLKSLKEGDSVDLGVFYISDRVVIKELIRAAERNVNINIILDPNKDAFGREKGGIPNRQVAHELMAKKNKNIQIRWYATSGEQYHSKFIVFRNDETTTIISGSANFTKRNLAGFNLESNLAVVIPNNHHLNLELSAYFKRIWNNQDGEYTTDYETYEDATLWKIWLYRFQEWSGLSTF